jgi:hypothetical protein
MLVAPVLMKRGQAMMPKKEYIPYSLTNINNKPKQYSGTLHHLGKGDITPFTWAKEPEFIFAAAAIVGRDALIIMRCINHKSSIQQNTDYDWHLHTPPVLEHLEYVRISNKLVERYGMARNAKYQALKVLSELNFIEHYPVKEKQAAVVRIDKSVLRYRKILDDGVLRATLRSKAKAIRKNLKLKQDSRSTQNGSGKTNSCCRNALELEGVLDE